MWDTRDVSTEKFVKPDFIGTEDSMITRDGVFPLPEAWKELVNFDVKAHWRKQDRERRRLARLDECMHDEEDDDSHQVPDEIFEEHDRLMFGEEG
jgi:hypothetical protein